MIKKVLPLLCLCLLLVGCSDKEEEVVEVTSSISTQADDYTFDSLVIPAIGPVCGFVEEGTTLRIYPYYDCAKHIMIEKIIVSSNDWWNTLISTQSEDYVVTTTETYSYITTPAGYTFGYIPIDSEWAYLVSTRNLNSGYLRLVMEKMCQQSS